MSDYTALTWFNVSAPVWLIPAPHRAGKVFVRLWNLHRRHSAKDGKWWGFGLLQIDKRHLFYVGQIDDRDGKRWHLCALYLGRTE